MNSTPMPLRQSSFGLACTLPLRRIFFLALAFIQSFGLAIFDQNIAESFLGDNAECIMGPRVDMVDV